MAKRKPKVKVPEVVEAEPLPWEEPFLEALARTGNATVSAKMVRRTRARVYQRRDESLEFRVKWEEAVREAVDLLEAEAARRAVQGVDRMVLHNGKQVMVLGQSGDMVPLVEKKYSDTLLIFLLKALRPHKYRERVSVELNDPLEALSEMLGVPRDRLLLAARGASLIRASEEAEGKDVN